jgi:hypothetical protein
MVKSVVTRVNAKWQNIPCFAITNAQQMTGTPSLINRVRMISANYGSSEEIVSYGLDFYYLFVLWK